MFYYVYDEPIPAISIFNYDAPAPPIDISSYSPITNPPLFYLPYTGYRVIRSIYPLSRARIFVATMCFYGAIDTNPENKDS